MKHAFGNILFYKGIVAVAPILLVMFAAARPALGIHAGKFPAVGNHLPVLELTDLKGNVHHLEWNLPPPKAAIIFFFDPRCADCLKEMVFLDHLFRRAEDFGLEAYAVEGSGLTASGTREAMQRYRQFYGEQAFPIIPDPDYKLSALFGIQRLPSTFILERHGVVLGRDESFEDWTAVDLTRRTEKLLKVEEGLFSFALRELGIDAEAEKGMERPFRFRTARIGRGKKSPNRLAAGDVVPGFEYTDINALGHEWRPSPEETGLTVVFFWGALCRPCIQEMALLDEVFVSVREPGLNIIAVEGSGLSPERTAGVMERYQRFHPFPSYRIVPDPDFRLANLFGVKGKMPQTFFISGTGAVLYHTDEFITGHEETLTGKIEMALNMDAGSLRNRMASFEERGVSPPVANEAPSIRAGLRFEEEFRSNLVEGDTYYGNWEFDKALPHYLRCLELEPNHAAIQVKVANIHERQGRLQEALEGWQRALELEPDNAEALSRVRFISGQGI